MKYTKEQNNRRYKLHYKCRQQGVEISVRDKTCFVKYDEKCNEFNYVVQFVFFVSDKRVNCTKTT